MQGRSGARISWVTLAGLCALLAGCGDDQTEGGSHEDGGAPSADESQSSDNPSSVDDEPSDDTSGSGTPDEGPNGDDTDDVDDDSTSSDATPDDDRNDDTGDAETDDPGSDDPGSDNGSDDPGTDDPGSSDADDTGSGASDDEAPLLDAGTANPSGPSNTQPGFDAGESTQTDDPIPPPSGFEPGEPLAPRGVDYLGFEERFNRYYTDPEWVPSQTVYVSADGNGSGLSADDPMSPEDGLAAAAPATLVHFAAGQYSGCFELDDSQSGTYDEPIVLYAERNEDGSPAVRIDCCDSGRQTCINLEAANYVAVDGFELVGGAYGVRAVGAGYGADEHQRGIAVLNSVGHEQDKDPFFTGQSDWFVIEGCTAFDTGEGDGHGIYLSNGSDWNIVRFNETYNTFSSDFQINADPQSTCADEGIEFDDIECDAVAGSDPTGGRGASDFFVVASNFFHHSLAQGPNFTSVRNSFVLNNVFALPARHGVSFWQETDNPNLGASSNMIAHNLFVTAIANRQALGITNSSTDNQVLGNVFVGVSIDGTDVSANPDAQLLATDGSTVLDNQFVGNAWIGGYLGSEDDAEPHVPAGSELSLDEFDSAWFVAFPTELARDLSGFAPTETAPWLDTGTLWVGVGSDIYGTQRTEPVDLGPFERP